MPTIYELDKQYRDIWNKLDSEEIDMDIAMSMMESIEEQQGNKIENMAMLIREFESRSVSRKIESDRLLETAKTYSNKADRIKKWLCDYMGYANMKKYEGRYHVVSVRESKAVNILNESLLTNEYKRHIPEKWEPDKAKIKEAIKNDKKVDGAEIITNYNLNIK